MTKPTKHQLSLINDIIDEFNFEKVHIAMAALDWKWAIPPTSLDDQIKLQVPTLVKLKEFARWQLIRSIETGYCSSGGLKSEYFPAKPEEITECGAIKQYAEPEYFMLTFELTSACSLSEYDG
tara:strand:- start:2419 stop:2787 length:369 start_codon:yes stop_codon:yes gene_type:complete